MREPTAEECNKNTEIEPNKFAAWYPQMGGYGSFCIVHDLRSDAPGCFDVYIWHDGEFPFSSADIEEDENGKKVAVLHHCDPEQFIIFGNIVKSKILKEV